MLLAGSPCSATALALHAIFLETRRWTVAARGGRRLLLPASGAYGLRRELAGLVRAAPGRDRALHARGRRRVARARLSVRALPVALRPDRVAGCYSLSPADGHHAEGLDRPVHIMFFHDPMMRETVELYELIAKQTPQVTVEFYDPMINPAQARMRGRAVRRHRRHGERRPQAAGQRRQRDGHRQRHPARVAQRAASACASSTATASPTRSASSRTITSRARPDTRHGLGAQYVLHERHGMAKARHALETLNYQVEKVSLLQRDDALSRLCRAGGGRAQAAPAAGRGDGGRPPTSPAGGNALFMLDPFVTTGLEPVAPRVRGGRRRRHRHRRGQPFLGRHLRRRRSPTTTATR